MVSFRVTILWALLGSSGGLPMAADDAASTFQSRVLPVLKASCAKCHGAVKQKAHLNFEGLRSFSAEQSMWFRVLDQLEAGLMPPSGEPQPTAAERQAVVAWIRGEYTDLLAAAQRREGRAKLRRLSRSEYYDTIYDLFGISPNVDELPFDGRVDGYDKVSAALPMTPDGSLGYLTIAEEVLKLALKEGGEEETVFHAIPVESEISKGHLLELGDGTIVSFNSDQYSGPLRNYDLRTSGMHHLRLSVYGYQTDKPLSFGIYGNARANVFPQQLQLLGVLDAPPGKPGVLETDLYLTAHDLHRLIPFGLGEPVPKGDQASLCKAPGLAIQWVEFVQPKRPLLMGEWLVSEIPKALLKEIRSQGGQTALQQTKLTTREEFLAVMQATFKRIGARIYRRDLTSAELREILVEIARQVDAGTPLMAAFENGVIDLLTSPDFFCLIESPGTLSDFALASRLSYFLWNSAPDEVLLDAARKGRLRDPKVLREQTDRLLNDGKSERFVRGFTDQWLGLNAIDSTTPDSQLYPEYRKNELIKHSSVWETRGSFRLMLDENQSVRSFVEPRWALVNEPLAKLYGLPDVVGSQLRKVTLPEESPFGGIWTQSAVMKVTANGTITSPVKRGVWVARRLLGISVPPPPPNVSPVEPDVRGAKTLREQLALHRANPGCAACHARFDPYGFALESFDVTGAFRKSYRVAEGQGWRDGLPVDCSGQVPDGRPFSGIAELRKILAANPEQLAIGVTRHLVTYATGSPATAVDQRAIEAIVKSTSAEAYGLRSLVHAIIQSDLFRSK
jgi:hypothetical protein